MSIIGDITLFIGQAAGQPDFDAVRLLMRRYVERHRERHAR